MPLDPNVQHLLRPFQGVDLGEIQNFKIRQAQEQRLSDEAAFAREKYGFEKQQIERQQQAQQMVGQAFRDSVGEDGEIDRSKLLASVAQNSPESLVAVSSELDKIDQAKLNRQHTQAQIDSLNSEVAKRQSEAQAANDQATARFGALVKHLGDTPQAWQMMRDAEIRSGRTTAEKLAPFDQAIAQDPSQISSVTSALMSYGVKPGEEEKQAEIERKNQAMEAIAQQRVQAQEDRATAAETRMEQAQAESARHNRAMEGLSAARVANEKKTAGGGVDLTPDALDQVAAAYRILGTRGIPTRFNDVDKKLIMNKAAEQAVSMGQSPATVIQRQAAFQADKSALTKMRTMQSGAAVAENKALNQIDIIKNLSAKVSRTSFPIINSVLQSGRTEVTGDTNATQLANAIQTFTSEYAKIIEGSTGSVAGSSDRSREASAKLVNAAMSKGTMNDVLELMRREMRLTMHGYDAVVGDISERMGGAPEPSPAAPSTGGTSGRVGKYTYTVK